MSDDGTVEFLATVPLLEGRDPAQLAELARVMRRRTVREGELLWRQGEDARELLVIVEGAVSALLHVPGNGTVEIGWARPRDVVGEIGLLDGKGHTMSVRATADTTMLVLGRLDFAALLAGQDPPAFRLKRRLAALLVTRLRTQLRHLALSLGGELDDPGAPVPADLEPSAPPDSQYVRRIAMFHDFDPLALWGFLTSGRYVRCPRGVTLLAEGAASTACYLTINGAVETVLVRGDRRLRTGLAGPGKAFGYEGLIDGGASPFTAIARERSMLLVVPHETFERLFNGEDAISRLFLDVIQRELLTALRQTLRQHARLAVSV